MMIANDATIRSGECQADFGRGVEGDPPEAVARQLGGQERVVAEERGDVEAHRDTPEQDRHADDDAGDRERPGGSAVREQSASNPVEPVSHGHGSTLPRVELEFVPSAIVDRPVCSERLVLDPPADQRDARRRDATRDRVRRPPTQRTPASRTRGRRGGSAPGTCATGIGGTRRSRGRIRARPRARRCHRRTRSWRVRRSNRFGGWG